MTQMGNEGSLHKFWNFHRKINIPVILTDNVCPNITDNTGNSLQIVGKNGKRFLRRYFAHADQKKKKTKETREEIKKRQMHLRLYRSYNRIRCLAGIKEKQEYCPRPRLDGVQNQHKIILNKKGDTNSGNEIQCKYTKE